MDSMRFQTIFIGVMLLGLAVAQAPIPADLQLRGDRFKPLTACGAYAGAETHGGTSILGRTRRDEWAVQRDAPVAGYGRPGAETRRAVALSHVATEKTE